MEDVDWIEEDVEIHTDFNHLKQKHTTVSIFQFSIFQFSIKLNIKFTV